jgi:hypothetical protein
MILFMGALQELEQEHPGRAGTHFDEVFARLPTIARAEGKPVPTRIDAERIAAVAFRAGFVVAAPSNSEAPMTRFHSTEDFFDLILFFAGASSFKTMLHLASKDPRFNDFFKDINARRI